MTTTTPKPTDMPDISAYAPPAETPVATPGGNVGERNDASGTETYPNDEADPDNQQSDQEQGGGDDSTNGNREAAKWRNRFRDLETAHADTNERLTAMQRQHVESLAEPQGVKPAALWATTELADLLADDGTVSVEAVTQAINNAADTLGLQLGLHVPAEGHWPTEPPAPSARQRWEEAFQPPVRH